ncbi:hypothetical protein B5F33_02865 [Collinsella sp. An2]|nr:hypothetical protein B5F33_02865 [Collinsella sp. An2]
MDVAGIRPSVDTDRPDAHVMLSLRGHRATLALDLSGEPLFRRMPRAATRHATGHEAHVLRPDYAALLLAQTDWPAACRAFHAGQAAQPPILVDACCAGGGVELEAALQLLDRAPGLDRRRWGFMGWGAHDEQAWEAERRAADERATLGSGRCEAIGHASIIATDADPQSRSFAQRLWHLSGIDTLIAPVEPTTASFEASLAGVCGNATHSATSNSKPSEHVSNVAPRGGLLADTTELPITLAPAIVTLMRDLRRHAPLNTFPAAVLAYDNTMDRALGTAPNKTLSVRPNNEAATIRRYPGATATGSAAAEANDGVQASAASATDAGTGTEAGTLGDASGASAQRSPRRRGRTASSGDANARQNAVAAGASTAASTSAAADAPAATATVDLGDGKPIPVLVPESEQFAHRLKKVARLRRRWAKRTGVTCYRVYDADLPDYAAAIDLYEGSAATPGRWLVIAEYAAPKTIDPALAQARMLDILAIAPHVLDVDPRHVYAKARMRSRGGSQYARKRTGGSGQGSGHGAPRDRKLPLIEEGGLTFAVNFDDYLDTGIFLDHRVTRGMVREHARGKRWFLNLFAYTGTATCYAADAGVEETVTVDLSNTYLDWAERNMAINGFTGPEHHYVRADVLGWIRDMRRTANRWDLIFCDPPTFSNSAKMGRRSFDVQRDHVELLRGVADLLTPDGEAIFSCNLRSFKPRVDELMASGVKLEDISAQTIPEDFARNPRIHRCYLVRRMY